MSSEINEQQKEDTYCFTRQEQVIKCCRITTSAKALELKSTGTLYNC